jgi:predicted kinase
MAQRGVFLVTGLPACGKTTLARVLAQALAAPLLMKDGIKEPLLDVFSAADPRVSRRLSNVSFAVLFALAHEQLASVGTVVLEGNFRPGEHERDVQALLARRALRACTQILCRVPEPLRQMRLQARASGSLRHPGHQDAAWVAQAGVGGDVFLNLDGPRFVHDGAMVAPLAGCALIRSLINGHLV